jgi:hypothetical protein
LATARSVEAYAVNNVGTVAGRLHNDAMRYKAALEVLPKPPGVNEAEGYGINNNTPEKIVGRVIQFGQPKATLWTDGNYMDLHANPNASYSEAYDINVGSSQAKNVRITPVWHDIRKSQNHLFGKPGAPGSFRTLLQARQVA